MREMLQFWGKTAKAGFHPAVYHMLDSGNVAQALLGKSSQWRHVAESVLGSGECAIQLAAYIASLHDLGKLTASFQGQVETEKNRLVADGWSFDGWSLRHSKPHALMGQAVLRSDSAPNLGLGSLTALAGEVMGGHHGAWQLMEAVDASADDLDLDEPSIFADVRAEAGSFLKGQFWQGGIPNPPENISTASMFLTGFTILADWISSDASRFPAANDVPLDEYVDISRERASRAVAEIGPGIANLGCASPSFASLFPVFSPRPLQTVVDRLDDDFLAQPSLTIIEAPTGEGKTEAALALAHRIGMLRGSDAFYYALPTTATSNQMYARVSEYLHTNLGLDAGVRLVHGQAQLAADLLATNGLDGHVDQGVISEWFAPRKRALLAPFGVGTVDQAELAALNVRHAALRMLGLCGQTLIIDEIHAYDMYMTTVIERLLAWLSKLDTSVILLSATLPQERVNRLRKAWDSGSAVIEDESYPRVLSVGNQGKVRLQKSSSFQKGRFVEVQTLEPVDDRPDQLARVALEKVQHGGCIGCITNTVQRAQELYRALTNAISTARLELQVDLVHARLPLQERLRREQLIVSRYGRDGHRPERGIVIGTQVLEQSLDLDFDVMISDIAPIDLLLQRAGRLHRHERPRPAAHSVPRLLIVTPDGDQRLEESVDARIYAPYLLCKTARLLDSHPLFQLPKDYRPLVEAVYGNGEETDPTLLALRQDLDRVESFATQEAQIRLLPEPNPDECFCRRAARLTFREDEDSSAWMVARTRLGPPSVTVIPLERDEYEAWLADDSKKGFSLGSAPSREDQLLLLRHQVRLSGARLVHLISKAVGDECELMKAPLLRHVSPLWLCEGIAELGDGSVQLRMDSELGVVIEWSKGEIG